MRVQKYRIWDYEADVMLYTDKYDGDDYFFEFTPSGLELQYWSESKMGFNVWTKCDKIKIMQFLGFKDKNNIDIYEEDICYIDITNVRKYFTNTRTHEFMELNKLERIILTFNSSDYLNLDYELTFLTQDGILLTKLEELESRLDGEEWEDLKSRKEDYERYSKTTYKQKINRHDYIFDLCDKKILEVVGNSIEDNE